MRYDFDKAVVREQTNCAKYDGREAVFGRADVVPMWVADMDFEVLPEITEAIRRRAEHSVYGYSFNHDSSSHALISWTRRRNGWEIKPEWIDYTPGVVAGFAFAIRALSEKRDGVVIMPPVYHPFAQVIKANERKLLNNPLKRDSDGYYTIDFDDLDRKLAEAKLLLFCNPHNPTGRVFTRDELLRVGELCARHNVIILSDEIHSDLIMKPHKHTHIASLSEDLEQRTVTFLAPSKTFNVAGLSTSAVVTPNESIRRRLRVEFDALHACSCNIFGFEALEAGYSHGEQWLEQLIEYIDGNMRYVIDFVGNHLPFIKVRPIEATYLLWIDMTEVDMSYEELVKFMIDEAGLGMNDGRMFGEEGEKFVRMNLATRRSVVEQAMAQLAGAFARRSK